MSGSKPSLEIRLFGPPYVVMDRIVVDTLTQRQMALLALLSLHPDQSLSKEWIIEQLWPGEGRDKSLLNKLVKDVHDALQPFLANLSPKDGMLRLDTSNVFVDAIAFDRAWANREADSKALAQAVDLYTGSLLQDWENWYAPEWATQARERYVRRYREALKWLTRRALQSSDFEGSQRYLQALREIGDLAEGLHCRMMECLMSAEQFVLASQFYEDYLKHLQERDHLAPRAMTERHAQIPRATAHIVVPYEPTIVEEEAIGGGMPLDSRYYITRPADALIHSAIKRRDSIVRIEGPRQTGKTSLLARALEQARQDGALVFFTDFQALGPEDTASLSNFFLALAYQFYRTIRAGVAPSVFWDTALSANMNFEGYLREVVLGETGVPVVWGIDEADRIFDRDYRSSVFGLFRSWHNKRALAADEAWQRLTLVMAYSSEARMLIPNPNESPFNVGTGTMLQDFSPEQVADLSQRYEDPAKAEGDLARLVALVGGHPYLVRRSLYEMKTRPAIVEEIEAESLRDNSLFAEHLDRILRTVACSPDRLQAALNLLQGKPCEDLDAFSRSRSAGVLVGDSMCEARFRCGLYKAYLRKHLL